MVTVCQRCEMVREVPISKLPNPFKDIKESDYFYTPVLWVVSKGITTGTSATTFSPNSPALRAQIVTFLWRAAGCPEPSATQNPFVDVSKSDYYYKAVLWAVESGITNGTDATHFSPLRVCSRCEVVTFLYRAFGQPPVETRESPFSDVASNSWFAAPVLWAVSEGITTGLTPTTFAPHSRCTRSQIATFLYRAYA